MTMGPLARLCGGSVAGTPPARPRLGGKHPREINVKTSYRWLLGRVIRAAVALMAPVLVSHADTVTYTYDPAGRLQQVSQTDGTVINYTLDAAGNRKSVVTTVDSTAPTVPLNVTGSVSSLPFQVNLTWSASSDTGSGVAGYRIYRGGTQIGTSTSAAYTDTTMACNAAYAYTVAAYGNATPPNVSGQSTPAWSTTTPFAPPTTPTGLTRVSATSTQVALSWTASSDQCGASITGYKVYRGGSQMGTSATASYTDATTSGTTTYSYTVAAYDSLNLNSAQSTALSVTTPDTLAPTTPTGLTATDVNAVQINLSWSASTDTGGSGLAGYKIYRAGTQIGTSTTTTYSDTTLSANTTYSYTVKAYDGAGNLSAASNTASATTNGVPSTPPAQPSRHGIVAASPWTESWLASAGPVHQSVLTPIIGDHVH